MRTRTRILTLILAALFSFPALAFPRRELALWLQSVTVQQRTDGALIFGDCYDRHTRDGLAFASGLGGRMSADLAPLRREFARRLGAQSLAPDALTRAWRNLIMTDGPALLSVQADALARLAVPAEATVATCTTGRCDCGACAANETCSCATPETECVHGKCIMTGCSGARADCNVIVYELDKLDTQNDSAAEALGR